MKNRGYVALLLGSSVLAGVAGIAEQAAAQTAATPNSGSIETVVVTAEKRPEVLLNVPASISAVSGKALEDLGATRLSDWAGYVPGLNITNDGVPGQSTITLEGIAPIGATSEAAVYVNDTPIGSSSSYAATSILTVDLMPYDLDRVEVVRGPQGTLYGASAMGGIIRYILASPDLSGFSGRVGGDLFGVADSSGAGGNVRAEVNVPIIDDQLGFRVSVFDQYTPGYIDDITNGRDHDNGLRQEGIRGALLWKPSTDLSIEFSAIDQKTSAANSAVVSLDATTNAPVGNGLSNTSARAQPFQQEFQLYDVNIEWDLHWAELTSISSYQKFGTASDGDETAFLGPYLQFYGLPNPGGADQSDETNDHTVKKYSQELRLASPAGGTLEWLIGGFYTHEASLLAQVVSGYNSSGVPYAGDNPVEFANIPSIYQEYAIFGDVTWHITDQIDLDGGLRYAHNNQTFTETEGGFAFDPANPNLAVLTVPGKSAEGVPTFQVAPSYHLNADTMLYARVASGYQPGGPNVELKGTTFPATFSSSRLIDYQAGLKSTFLDGHATADISAFYIDWTSIQVLDYIPGIGSGLVNGGTARSEGVELSTTYSPIDGLVFGGNLTYDDAVLTRAIPTISVASGARLPDVPLWAGSLTVNYTRPVFENWNGFFGAGYRYTDSTYSFAQGEANSGEAAGFEAGGYSVVDLHLGVTDESWKISLYAKNLTNTRAYTQNSYGFDAVGLPINGTASVLQPRTIGISVDKSF